MSTTHTTHRDAAPDTSRDSTSRDSTSGDSVSTSTIIDLRGSTSAIENNHITLNARKGYIRVLTTFMLFLYNHDVYHDLLTNVVPLREAKQKDIDEFNSAAARLQSSRSAVKLKDKNFRAECQRQLFAMSRKNPNNSPIKLEGEGALKYECIAEFMNTKSNTETVNRGLVSQVENEEAQANGSIRRGGSSRPNETSEMVQVKVQQSKSAYTAVQSAIAYLYRQNNTKRSEELKQRMSTYIAGCTRRCEFSYLIFVFTWII